MAKLLKNSMDSSIKIFDSPNDLPGEWDQAFPPGDIFNKTKMLKHLYATNSAIQKYFWKEISGEKPLAGTIWFTSLPFTLGPATIYRPVTVCSVPMAFSIVPGFSDLSRLNEVTEIMDCFGSGFQMIAGLQQNEKIICGWTRRRFLVSVNMDISWNDFDEYYNNLRSHYRSRITTTLKAGEKLEVVIIPPEKYEEKLYNLYVKTAKNYNSLVLSREYFSRFPLNNYILGLSLEGTVIAWALLVPSGSYLYFLFGGFDKTLNQSHQIYNNLLLNIVKFSIEKGFKNISLGQTSELSKMRVGGYPIERFILIRHSNPLINQIIKHTDIFNYRKKYAVPNLFKS